MLEVLDKRAPVFRLVDLVTREDEITVKVDGPDVKSLLLSGPLNPLHREWASQRALALSVGLNKALPGMCRYSELENLLFVSGYHRDLSRMRKWPFTHQVYDMESVIAQPFFFITSEMRTGKTKIVIDAAQFLFDAGLINKVIVVAPAPVRDVWFDRQLGEIAKHSWADLPSSVIEFHAVPRRWYNGEKDPGQSSLQWWVTNYEFLRSKARVTQLLPACGPKTLLVEDESSYIKNHAAEQSKACFQVRECCARVVLINGTPLYHSPRDLFSQGNMLDPSILDCKYITHYEMKYGIRVPILERGKPMMRYGKVVQTVESWVNLEDLQRRFAPYTVRRLQADCLDLPPKLEPVTLTAVLDASWPAYKQMRDDMVVWLKSGDVAVSSTAAIKSLRLSQITSGFLGGVEESGLDQEDFGDWTGPPAGDVDLSEFTDLIKLMKDAPAYTLGGTQQVKPGAKASDKLSSPVQEVGREKLDVLLWLIGKLLEEDENLHLVSWSRFRPELFRTMEVVAEKFPQFECASIQGSQKPADRLRALGLLKPETSPVGPVFVGGIEGTGSFGLDMSAAHTCVTMSSGYSPGRTAQTLDRLYGPGQTHPIAYYDIVAVGPKGQKTIDKDILIARRAGQDIATWTAAAWVKALTEE